MENRLIIRQGNTIFSFLSMHLPADMCACRARNCDEVITIIGHADGRTDGQSVWMDGIDRLSLWMVIQGQDFSETNFYSLNRLRPTDVM